MNTGSNIVALCRFYGLACIAALSHNRKRQDHMRGQP